MVKIVNNYGQYKVTIPKDIIEVKGWSSKTELRFIEDINENIILKPVKKGGIKVVANAGQYKITVPIDVIDDKGWSSKTKLRFVENTNGDIILREIKPRK